MMRNRRQTALYASNWQFWQTPITRGETWRTLAIFPPYVISQATRNAVLQSARRGAMPGERGFTPGGGYGGASGRFIEPLSYGDLTDFTFFATQADQIMLAGVTAPLRRTYLAIQNQQDTQKIYLRYGARTALGAGYIVQPGETHIPPGEFVPQNDVHIIAEAGGTGQVFVLYSHQMEYTQ